MNKETILNLKALVLIVGILITLKLTGVEPIANWPWLFVFSPVWGPFALCVVILMAAFALVCTVGGPFILISAWTRQKKQENDESEDPETYQVDDQD